MYLVPLKFHGTRNLNVMIFEVRGYVNFPDSSHVER